MVGRAVVVERKSEIPGSRIRIPARVHFLNKVRNEGWWKKNGRSELCSKQNINISSVPHLLNDRNIIGRNFRLKSTMRLGRYSTVQETFPFWFSHKNNFSWLNNVTYFRSESHQRDQMVSRSRPGLHRQLQPGSDAFVAVFRQLGRVHAPISRWGNDILLCWFTAVVRNY